MAQADYVIANQSAPNVRSELNTTFAAIVSQNSGATAPSTTYPYQLWYDTSTNIMKMRNADDDAWIALFTFNQTDDTVALSTMTSGTITNLSSTTFNGANSVSVPGGWVSNLRVTYSSNTLTITGNTASLSATNPAYVVMRSKSSPGTLKAYTITADQSFIDSGGVSNIIGNRFGLPTGVAYAEDIPFCGYLVCNDAETDLAVMTSRTFARTTSPVAADIGDPSSATADNQWSFFSFKDITEADYDQNPCIQFFSHRMRMNASDDWANQALVTTDSIGQFQQNILFDFPTGAFGAATNSHFLDNTGNAPIFTTRKYQYSIDPYTGILTAFINFVDVSTDGVGAVSTQLSLPFLVHDDGSSSEMSIGGGYWDDSSLSKPITIMCRANQTNQYAFSGYVSDTTAGRNVLNNFLVSNDDYKVQLNYKIATS